MTHKSTLYDTIHQTHSAHNFLEQTPNLQV